MTIILPIYLLIAAAAAAPPSLAADPVGARAEPNAASGTAKPRTHKRANRAKKLMSLANNDDGEGHPKTALALARELGISSDDTRPDQQREVRLFGTRLILGGKVTMAAGARRNYDLASGANDDDVTAAPEATLEAIWLPSSTDVVFAAVKGTYESMLYRGGGGARDQSSIELDSLWYLKTRILRTPLAVQVGRQKMQDRRNWWWNENLDAVRLHYFGSQLTAFAGVGEVSAVNLSTRNGLKPEERGLLRAFATAEWEWTKRNTLSLFALHQSDRTSRYVVGAVVGRNLGDRQDANLTWIGARARGCVTLRVPRRVCYWGNVARVSGSEVAYGFRRAGPTSDSVNRITNRTVGGWGYDTGVSIELPIKIRPYLTLGYARGSGDRPGTPGRDGAFRQTGLHNNDGKFRGLTRFRYYGEVLRPNLSNIAIGTVALGVPVRRHGWVETVWHHYRQPVGDRNISGSRLNRDPNGIDGRLGNELDLILSYRPPSGWVFEFTGGVFRAGRAFGPQSGSLASMAELKIDYNF